MSENDISPLLCAQRQRMVTGPSRTVCVVRTLAWETAYQVFKRKTFSEKNGLLHVHFIGGQEKEGEEGAIGLTDAEAYDAGGPRREFFRLLMHDLVRKSGLLEGNCH